MELLFIWSGNPENVIKRSFAKTVVTYYMESPTESYIICNVLLKNRKHKFDYSIP